MSARSTSSSRSSSTSSGKAPRARRRSTTFELADAVLVLGEDLTNTAPLLDLAVRQAVRNKPKEKTAAMRIPNGMTMPCATPRRMKPGRCLSRRSANTKLDAFATRTYHAAPDDIARLGFAIAHELNPVAPALPHLCRDTVTGPRNCPGAQERKAAAHHIRNEPGQRGRHPGRGEHRVVALRKRQTGRTLLRSPGMQQHRRRTDGREEFERIAESPLSPSGRGPG